MVSNCMETIYIVEGHLGCFEFGVKVNRAAINTMDRFGYDLSLNSSRGNPSGVRLLDHMAKCAFFASYEATKLFSSSNMW